MKKDKVTIVVPCYNEEESLPLFYEEVKKVSVLIKNVIFEYLFVDDGSEDKTFDVIKKLSKNDKKVRYISLSRNFGKEAAIYAGLEHATGDYVAVIDADLQDPPALLQEMYNTLKEGYYDSVAARRVSRGNKRKFRNFCANKFYKIISRISKIDIVDGARDFRLMTRRMVNAILEVKEYNRFSKGIFGWVGYKTKWLEYGNVERVAGSSKWTFLELILYSMEGIMSYSTAPLVVASLFGMLFLIVSFILIVFIIVKTLIYGDPTSGWPSLACIMFFIGGIQLFCTGIIGEYLSKTYLETKKRPIYIIKETEKDKK